ncbi:MAG: metallophosphoesterase [Erysipelotrichaceae bacterium]|nr:metallophosphoesterase [Erysipelotrichaceae bacterium]MBQ6126161.1 metallophosphoesterase [Erysipelotrichaceae bacterium]
MTVNKTKKLFIFSDVHSYYDELMSALDDAGFDIDDHDHIIVSLGDLCDRGPKSREVLSFINSIPEERKLCVIGNHEILMELMIRRGRPDAVDTYNGVVSTAIDITEEGEGIEDLKHNKYWNEYKKSWHWYFEVGNYIFVHGWIPCFHKTEYYSYDPDWRNSDVEGFYDSIWVNGMELWSKGIREPGKTVICGHINTSWGHCHLHHDGIEYPDENRPELKARFDPFIDDGIIALDASTPYSGKVNVYVLELEKDLISSVTE